MAKRVKLGDIVEIDLEDGRYSYAQVTHIVPKWGAFLLVFEGFYKVKLNNFDEISNGKMQFRTFYPLQYSVNQSIVKIICNEKVRNELSKFPFTRNSHNIDREGKVHSWYITEGKKKYLVKKLSEEQKDYASEGVVNHTMFVNLIKKQWRHRDSV